MIVIYIICLVISGIHQIIFMNSEIGKYLIFIGLGIALLGLVLYFFHDKLHWIGHLPGDIRIEKENFKFYFPITTMLLLSLAIGVLIRIFRKLF